eukprot:TRINITY_DN1086_c0_g5_i1.p1 TRINITY_DN1086_c0_g5~~TRINITY_DN1086_c0_g5_i1.p1  ORF type:complete len:117 (-),score=32.20 TRINITY_DN1086_c0_g5_i1:27-377(-)
MKTSSCLLSVPSPPTGQLTRLSAGWVRRRPARRGRLANASRSMKKNSKRSRKNYEELLEEEDPELEGVDPEDIEELSKLAALTTDDIEEAVEFVKTYTSTDPDPEKEKVPTAWPLV